MSDQISTYGPWFCGNHEPHGRHEWTSADSRITYWCEVVGVGDGPAAATCSTCTHWRTGRDHYPDWDKPAPTGSEVPTEDHPRWGWCGLIGLPEHGEAVTVTAFTRDASDYKADLHTRDDFGCTLHESTRPAPETER